MILKAGDVAPDFELPVLTGKGEVDHSKGVPELQTLKDLLGRGPAHLVFVKEDCSTCEYNLAFSGPDLSKLSGIEGLDRCHRPGGCIRSPENGSGLGNPHACPAGSGSLCRQ